MMVTIRVIFSTLSQTRSLTLSSEPSQRCSEIWEAAPSMSGRKRSSAASVSIHSEPLPQPFIVRGVVNVISWTMTG